MKTLLPYCIILFLAGCASESKGVWFNSDGFWKYDKGVWLDSKGWDAPDPAQAANEKWFNNYYGKSEGCNIHGC